MEYLINNIRKAIIMLPDSEEGLVHDLHSVLLNATRGVIEDEKYVKECVQSILSDSFLNSNGGIKVSKVSYAMDILRLFDME